MSTRAPELARVQRALQEWLLSDDASTPGIEAIVASDAPLRAATRLAIYRDGYRIRLRQALSGAFDKTHALLGDSWFLQMCDLYIKAEPSRHDNLRWYGERFADHLARALPAHPFVAELAEFEWTLGLAFDAADAPAITLAVLADQSAAAWEHLGFALQPALHCLTLQWNVVAMWLALEADGTPPPPAPPQTHWLVWRTDLQPRFRSTTAAEVAALQALARGDGFAQVCQRALENQQDADITQQVAGWLQQWCEDGLIAAMRPQPCSPALALPCATAQRGGTLR